MNVGSSSSTHPGQVTSATRKNATQGITNATANANANATNNTTSAQSPQQAALAHPAQKVGGATQTQATHGQVQNATAAPASTSPSVNTNGQTVGRVINVSA